MVVVIKDLPRKKYLLPGNTACQGCPHTLGLKALGMALGDDIVLVIPAGCITVIAGIGKKSSLNFPCLHVPFASAPAVATGISSALKRLKKNGIVVVWMGDGASDIGFSTLSGAANRNDDMIVIVSDNEAYMNTGIQTSGTTFWKAITTVSPSGKTEEKKDLALIMMMHKANYVATASVGYLQDFIAKLRKAKDIDGFRFIHLHSPCPTGWGFDSSETVEIARMAVKCGAWILWEYDGEFKISSLSRPYKDKSKRMSVREYLKRQRRFRHLSDEDIKYIERKIEEQWRFVTQLESLNTN